jgi:hypothetical protein
MSNAYVIGSFSTAFGRWPVKDHRALARDAVLFKVLSIPIPGPTAEMFIAPNGEQMVVIVIETGQAQSDAFTSWRVGPE